MISEINFMVNQSVCDQISKLRRAFDCDHKFKLKTASAWALHEYAVCSKCGVSVHEPEIVSKIRPRKRLKRDGGSWETIG